MDQVFGSLERVILISGNGKTAKFMAMEFIQRY